MSYYYKYTFTSPEPIYAIVREELKSYFDTGAIDDLMFPTYLGKCLDKLGRGTYVITNETLFIEDYQARLPDNFHAVREAWHCAEVTLYPYQSANSFYSQTALSTTIQISPLVIDENSCVSYEYSDETCLPVVAQAVYKTNNSILRSYTREYLLKPGNISAKSCCDVGYMDNWERYNQSTPYSSNYNSFDVRDNKFVTNFRIGIVDLVFYATDYDNSGNQLVPDNFRIKEYIEAFIKYKMFETLTNQTNDETFNQLQQKMVYYKQLSDEAFIMADMELKKQDPWTKQQRIKASLNRNRIYELPNRSYPYGWRRNN